MYVYIYIYMNIHLASKETIYNPKKIQIEYFCKFVNLIYYKELTPSLPSVIQLSKQAKNLQILLLFKTVFVFSSEATL